MLDLIDPKEIEVTDVAGNKHRYRIGRLPYLAGGREVCSKYIATISSFLGNYQTNEDMARKLFSHIAVIHEDGTEQRLTTDELINNHVPDFKTGTKVEVEALEHNAGFSVAGLLQKFRREWAEKLPGWISKTLTALRDALPAQDNAPSKNSKRSTRPKTPS